MEGTYYEQPMVTFTDKMVLQVEGSGAQPLYWSTVTMVNDLASYPSVRVPYAKSSEVDYNLDGIIDQCNIHVRFPLAFPVLSVELLLLFQYSLQQRVRMTMETAVFLKKVNPVAGVGLQVSGRLALQQLTALPTTVPRTVYSNAILNDSTVTDIESAQMATLLQIAQARNESTYLADEESIWQSGSGASEFAVDISIAIDNQIVSYIPPVAEVLKFALIQYFPLYMLLYWLRRYMQSFIFTNQIIETRSVADTTPVSKLHQF